MVSVGFIRNAMAASAAIAKLVVPRFDNGAKAGPTPVNHLGTGWLLTKDLLMTNHHAINARNEGKPAASESDLHQQAKAASVEFDYDSEGIDTVKMAVLALRRGNRCWITRYCDCRQRREYRFDLCHSR